MVTRVAALTPDAPATLRPSTPTRAPPSRSSTSQAIFRHRVAGGPGVINWKASGRGPRLADFAYLIWGTGAWSPRRPNQERIDAAVNAYRRHVEPTDDELDRLEAVMYIRTLYLACFGYRRAVTSGQPFNEWGFIRPREYFTATAAATRAAFGRWVACRYAPPSPRQPTLACPR